MKRFLAIALFACTMASPVVAADAPDKPHTIVLKDSELELIQFMVQTVGARCSSTKDGLLYCAAQLRAVDLVDDLNKQLQAKPPEK